MFSTFALGFFFVIASYTKNASLPPSNAGKGNKLTNPKFTLKTAIQVNNEPCCTADFKIVKIPTGPLKSSTPCLLYTSRCV